MAGIKNIRDLYKKVGEKGLREVLEEEIRVTEKFDAYRFAFEKNPHNYKIYFYGKNGKAPLNKIDRTVNDLYEAAVAHIENLPADIKKAIPVRHRFGFSWFPTKAPLGTEYERRPKRGLVLTDITVRNRDRDVTRDVKESQVFSRWAAVLGVESSAAVFEGRLSSETIDGLIEMAKNDYAIGSLNESQVNTKGLLNETHQSIEALVFESKGILFKVSSEDKEEIKPVAKRSHLFDILLLDICEHLNSMTLTTIKPVSVHADEAYIEIVSDVFNDFVEKKGKDFLESTLERPKFLEKSGGFNASWIKNPRTLSLVESNHRYEYLFTVFLTNLRKPKYASGLLSEAVINTYNAQIEEINRMCEGGYAFLEFATIPRDVTLHEATSVLAKNAKEETPDPALPNVEQAVILLHAFFNRSGLTSSKDPVDVLVINGAMPTNRVILEAQRMHQESGLSVLLVHDIQQNRIKVEDDVVEKMLSAIVDSDRELFAGYEIITMPILNCVLLACKSQQPRVISCNAPLAEVLQLELGAYLAAKGSMAIPYKVEAHGERLYKDCLSSLDADSFTKFKECMPKAVHAYWSSIKNAFDKQTYY